MLGAGLASAAMNGVLKNNRQLLRKKNLFKNDEKFLKTNPNNLNGVKGKVKVEKISEEVLAEIREKTLAAERIKNIKILLFTVIVLPFVALIFAYGLAPSEELLQEIEQQQQITRRIGLEKDHKLYTFYMEDGSKWLKRHRYHNAIFQYKKAVEVFPSNFEAHYQLIVAYSTQYQNEFKKREEGLQAIENFEYQLSISKLSPSEISHHQQKVEQLKLVFERWEE